MDTLPYDLIHYNMPYSKDVSLRCYSEMWSDS